MPPDERRTDDAAPRPDEGGQEASAPEREEPGRRPWWKTTLLVVGGILGTLVLLVALLVLYVQTDAGQRQVKDLVLPRLNEAFDGARLEVDEVEGSIVGGLQLYGVRLYENGTNNLLLQADTLAAKYRLWPLLSRELHLYDAYLANPRVQMEQAEDGSWDLARAFAADSVAVEEAPATQTEPFQVALDGLALRNGRAELRFYNPAGDSVLAARDVYANLGTVEFAGALNVVDVDTLYGLVSPPTAEYYAQVALGATLRDDTGVLRNLSIQSPRTELVARGRLRLPTDTTTTFEDIEFTAVAQPLDFRDLAPLFPTLSDEPVVNLEARTTGTSQLLSLYLAATASDGASVQLEGEFAPPAGGPLDADLTAEVRNLTPSYFLAGPSQNPATINVDAEVQLEGDSLAVLDGTVALRVFDTQVAGQRIQEALLRAQLEDGATDATLRADLAAGQAEAAVEGRFFADVPTYEADVDFRNVDLAVLTGNPQQHSDLTGSLTASGTGFDPETMELRADLDLTGSTLAGRRFERAGATVRLDDGRLRAEADLAGPGGAVSFLATARFEGETIRYDVERARFQNLDLAAFTGNPDQRSSLTGTLTAEGAGTDLETLNLTARLDLEPSFYGDFEVEDGEAAVTLHDGRLRFDADAALQGGAFAAEGAGRFFGDVPTYQAEGTFERVNLAAFADSLQQSNLSGTFQVEGAGFEPRTSRIEASVDLAPSTYGGTEIEAADLAVNLRRGGVAFDVDVQTEEGDVAAEGTARPFGNVVTYDITEGRLDSLNLAAFTGNPQTDSRLTGTFTAEGRGTDLETLALQADVNLRDSRFNRQELERVDLTVALEEGLAQVEGTLATPEGVTRLIAEANLLAEDGLQFAVQEGTFRGLNVGALLGIEGLDTSLNLRLEADGSGTLDDGRYTFQLVFRPSQINGARLLDGRIVGSLADGELDAEALLDFAQGRLDLAASGLLFPDTTAAGAPLQPRTYRAEGTAQNLPVGDLLGIDTLRTALNLEFALAGRGTDPATMLLEGYVEGRDMQYEETAIERLYTDFRYEEGYLVVDTLDVRSNVADVQGGGRVALLDPDRNRESNFRFDATVRSLAPLRPFVDAQPLSVGTARARGRVSGEGGIVRFDLMTEVTSLAYNQIRLADFEGRVLGMADSSRTFRDVRADLQAGYLSVPQLTVENTQLEATYDTTALAFDLDMVVDERRDLQAEGLVDFHPDRQRIQLATLNLRLDEDHWQLLQPTTIAYGEEYDVQSLLLYADDQQIAVDGVIDPDGRQNLVVTIEGFRVGAVADLLDFEGLGGTLTGTLDLTGPADGPVLTGLLDFDVTSYNDPVGDLRLDVDYASERLGLTARLSHVDGSTLVGEGSIPIDLRIAEGIAPSDTTAAAVDTTLVDRLPGDQPSGVRVRAGREEGEVDFTLRADSFAIGWVRPFLDPETVSALAGRLEGELNVGGRLEAPTLNGELGLFGGKVGLPQLGLTYENARATVRLEDDAVLLEQLRVEAGDGRYTGEGRIDLAELTVGEFALEIRGQNALLIDTREQRIVADASLQLSGTTQRPQLTGGVQVLSADIYLPEETAGALENVELTEDDLRMLERTFGVRVTEEDTTTFDFYQALDAQLDIELERNTWLRSRSNPELAIQFYGELDFQKDPYGVEQLFGTIEVNEQRSYVEQFGKRFKITNGLLRFNGPATNPYLDITAEYEVPARDAKAAEVTIILSLSGQLQLEEEADPLDVELSANPPLTNTDIISYLATGRPASESLGGGGGSLSTAGGELALGQLTGLFEGFAGEQLGLDVIEIKNDLARRTTSLTVGKYLSPRLYTAISRRLNASESGDTEAYVPDQQLIVEYELLEWLLGRVTLSDFSRIQTDLFYEFAY